MLCVKMRRLPRSTLFPYTTLFRSRRRGSLGRGRAGPGRLLRRGAAGRKSGEDRGGEAARDRKSTRLNSSHVSISYAVFCLKKKYYPFYRNNTIFSGYNGLYILVHM